MIAAIIYLLAGITIAAQDYYMGLTLIERGALEPKEMPWWRAPAVVVGWPLVLVALVIFWGMEGF